MMAAEKAFPNPYELEVASALLLLSTTMPDPLALISIKLEKSCKRKKVMVMNDKSPTRLSVTRSDWSSSSSSITSNNQQQEKVIAIVTQFHDIMKLKEVRKRRSKTFCISDCRKINSGFPETEIEASASASASSCITSSSSSAISSASSRDVIRKREHLPVLIRPKDAKLKKTSYSGHMRRRAEAILNVLTAQGSVSEVQIRHLLGDNPSTSKALRILLNLEKVKRTGAGGRTDPYIYTIA